MIHFRHKFHPAGHGTFFSGHIWHDGQEAESFAWVYDCGSKRPSRIRGLVEEFAKREGAAHRLDVLCVSHFDSDHVSGLTQLLKNVSVDVLVLPYMTIKDRLLLASEISEEGQPYAASVVAMTLDPLGFLASQGFAERIGRTVFIRGDNQPSGGEGVEPVRTLDVPPRGEASEGRFQWSTETGELKGYGSVDGFNVELASHRTPLIAARVYELVFYNPVPAEDTLLRSKSLGDVVGQVSCIIEDYDLLKPGPPKDGWVEALKHCYADNFGALPKQKNEISLCVFGAPLVKGPFKDCGWFAQRDEMPARPLVAASRKNSILLTGDVVLNRQRLRAIQVHLGDRRWNSLQLMQIPHHGSRNNWELGTAAHCAHDHSIFCAPGVGPHPDDEVKKDLATRNPVVVDYLDPVCVDFHVELVA